jgi:IclR family pca regulon transcriptional regulator
MTTDSRYRVHALARGLTVLSCFRPDLPRLRMTDLAEMTGFNLPTVFRIVRTLVGEGYLEEVEGGWLRPSLGVMKLGFSAVNSLDVVDASSERLRMLAQESQETVNMAVRDGDMIVYLVRIRNSDLVTADLRVGSRLPAAATSMGKLLLAYAPDDDRDAVIDGLDLAALDGPNALRDKALLRQELRRIRDYGWAYQDQELAFGLRSIAAPIIDSTQRVIAAVNIVVAAHRCSLEDVVDRYLGELVKTAGAISLSLGGQPAAPATMMLP